MDGECARDLPVSRWLERWSRPECDKHQPDRDAQCGLSLSGPSSEDPIGEPLSVFDQPRQCERNGHDDEQPEVVAYRGPDNGLDVVVERLADDLLQHLE
jgi:hypothetical protein